MTIIADASGLQSGTASDAARGALWFGFLGGPIAWSVQELASYAVMAHACYPTLDPLTAPEAGWAWSAALGLSVVLLLVAVAALIVSRRQLGRTIPDVHDYAEASAASHRATASPYLAFGGVALSAIFVALIVYNCIAFLAERACG